MRSREFVGLTLQIKSIKKIDQKRGQIPRSRYVDNILESALGEDEIE